MEQSRFNRRGQLRPPIGQRAQQTKATRDHHIAMETIFHF
jgi:hypothetical protein